MKVDSKNLENVIADYLEEKLPSTKNVRVSNLHRIAAGSSRAMCFFDFHCSGDSPLAPLLAFRADDTNCFRDEYEESLHREYEVYKCLESTNIPVPKNYWYESDSKWIGEPFVIREVLSGQSSLATEPVELQRKVLENFVDVLADQHTLDWKAAGLSFLGVPERPEDCASALLDKWDEAAQKELLEPNPLATACVTWLRNRLPAKVDRIVLNQGQVGPGQFLYGENAEIIAQLDWEQAYLGDPMSDIAYFIFSVQPIAGHYVDDLLERYSRRSGIPILSANLEFYSVFQSFWATVHCWTAVNNFATNKHRELQTFQLGLRVPQIFLQRIADTIGTN